MEIITLKIEGMTCGHCKNAVERMLKEQEGVISADVNLNDASANVSFNSEIVTKDALIDIINNSEMYQVV
ncbi:MAG: cation transporter [Bacteroidota bacterium]|nr:cation transporter [Bacteroidota bacterium]